jgi:6-pyruvoyl-tetrahydropterin synthase
MLFLKKTNLEAVKGKMKEIDYSFDKSHLNEQNSDRHSFKNPEGYQADLVIFKNSMKPYVSFSAP